MVYLVSAGVTLLLLLLVPAALAYGAYRLLSRHRKPADKIAGVAPTGFRSWRLDQKRTLVLGIVLAILFIQLVMKKCFLFGNLLLSPALPPEPAWLSALLIGKDETLLALFFTGLVASVAVTGGLLILGGRGPADAATRALFWLLAFLESSVEILLLSARSNFSTAR